MSDIAVDVTDIPGAEFSINWSTRRAMAAVGHRAPTARPPASGLLRQESGGTEADARAVTPVLLRVGCVDLRPTGVQQNRVALVELGTDLIEAVLQILNRDGVPAGQIRYRAVLCEVEQDAARDDTADILDATVTKSGRGDGVLRKAVVQLAVVSEAASWPTQSRAGGSTALSRREHAVSRPGRQSSDLPI